MEYKSQPSAKYFYRLETRKVKEPDFPYPKETISCTKDLLKIVNTLQDSDIEKFIILYLDNRHQFIGINITPGTVSTVYVYPREIVKNALLCGANAVVVVHNHPTGDLTPSVQDGKLTKTLKDCMALFDIRLLDHVIMGGDEGKYYSFFEEGTL